MFEDLTSLDDVRAHVMLAYQMAQPAARVLRKPLGLPEGDAAYGALPAHVANPAPLMARAVEISGADGISRQELLKVFSLMGQERKAAGLKVLAEMPEVTAEQHPLANKAGRLQPQTVFYWRPVTTS